MQLSGTSMRMQRLWLDYRRDDPARRRPGFVLLALGVVAVVLTSVDYFAVAGERDDLQAQVATLRTAAEATRAAAPVPKTLPSPGTTAGPTAARWDALFDSLESAAAESVTLLSLHPAEKEIQIGGEAKDFDSAVDYVQRLQSAPALANVRLTQSQVVAENPRRPVRFTVVAEWRGGR